MKDTITIKKDSLWKYASFILGALVIVLLIVMINKNNATTKTTTGGNTVTPVSVDTFLSNPSLYPSLGPDNAQTTVIEFSDFQCPFCAMASGLPSWVNNYGGQYDDLIGLAQKIQDKAEAGKLKFVYVPMSFLGQESVYAAQAALCANKQGKFWEMHDAIFIAHDSKENNGKFNKDKLEIIAATVEGMDVDSFNSCLENDETLADVQQVASEANSAATGTPTFYVNGQKVQTSWQQISPLLPA